MEADVCVAYTDSEDQQVQDCTHVLTATKTQPEIFDKTVVCFFAAN